MYVLKWRRHQKQNERNKTKQTMKSVSAIVCHLNLKVNDAKHLTSIRYGRLWWTCTFIHRLLDFANFYFCWIFIFESDSAYCLRDINVFNDFFILLILHFDLQFLAYSFGVENSVPIIFFILTTAHAHANLDEQNKTSNDTNVINRAL